MIHLTVRPFLRHRCLFVYLFIFLEIIIRAMDKINPPVTLEHPEKSMAPGLICLTTAHQLDFDYPPEFFEHAAILWSDGG